MPKSIPVAQVEINLPGYAPFNGTIDYLEGEKPPNLDEAAIQLHELVNDLVMSIRKNKPTVSGKDA
jgi:hypothetical protein